MTVSQLKKLLEPYSDVDILGYVYDGSQGDLVYHEIESFTVTVRPDGELLRVVVNLDTAEAPC